MVSIRRSPRFDAAPWVRRAAVALLLLLSLSAVAPAAVDVPSRPNRYVTDLAGVADAARMAALNERLADFERQTSNQIVVYVDRRLPAGTTLEEFASRTFKAWGVGQKGKDNGVVLFVFIDDRKTRIEVGYGLEGAIPDARARQILDAVLTPRFRQGNFTGGLEAAAQELMSAARGEPFRGTGRTVAESRPAPAVGGWRALLGWGFPPLLGLVVGLLFRGKTGRLDWALLAGAGASCVFWIFAGTAIANDVRPMLLGFSLLLAGVAVAAPVMIGKTSRPSGAGAGRRRVGWVLLQAGTGLVLLSLALLAAGGLWSATFGLAGPAFLLGILFLCSGSLLHATDPLEIVTLLLGRSAFAALGISGVYLGMSASSATPFPGRQVAIDTAVVSGLVFVMALILARSRGWRMGPESPGSISWGFSSSGSGSWSSGGSSSWSSSSSSSSSSFSGGGGSSGGGGASGSW